jgi:hypothetical protein
MDEVTQQNSALVEENAATAKTLEGQAGAMENCVAFFKLDEAARDDGVKPQPGKVSGKMSGKASGRARDGAVAMRRSA